MGKSIKTSQYYKDKLILNNDYYKNGVFDVIDYKSPYLIIKDKYGYLKVRPGGVLRNHRPSIKSAINKTSYWVNRAKEIHGDTYDYSKVEYRGSKTKITITCKKHGDFEQSPEDHIQNKGCSLCGLDRTKKHLRDSPNGWSYSRWEEAANHSKYFDSFKVYIIECWNKDEKFYKIGKTYQTIDYRFKGFPYNYKIITVIESNNSRKISNLERRLLNKHNEYRYQPIKNFCGMHECFHKINL